MDTIFPDSHVHYRSINNPFLFHAGYIFIILLESFMTFCCIKESWLLFKNINSNAAAFHAAKNWSVDPMNQILTPTFRYIMTGCSISLFNIEQNLFAFDTSDQRYFNMDT